MESLQEATSWFTDNLLWLVVIGAVLVLAYAYSGPLVDTLVRRALRATEGDFTGVGVEDHELRKRSATIVALVTTLIRLSLLAIAVLIFVGLTGSEWILLLIGLFIAGITIAGQSIVLDYLMGILILVEGQFFQGDNIELGDKPWKGTVESVGLRRTVIRAVDGTVYSVSNGDLRSVANRTRIYAAGEVRVRGIRQGDLAAVAEIMDRVGTELAAEPDFADAIVEAPHLAFVDDGDELGEVAVMRGRVVAGDRWRVATELRLRLDRSLTDAGIELNRLALPDGRSIARR
jgi:small-conductance mechanosensitive channel